MFLCDAWRVTIRFEGVVRSKAVHLPLAVTPDRSRDLLGLSIEQTEAPSSGSRSARS